MRCYFSNTDRAALERAGNHRFKSNYYNRVQGKQEKGFCRQTFALILIVKTANDTLWVLLSDVVPSFGFRVKSSGFAIERGAVGLDTMAA